MNEKEFKYNGVRLKAVPVSEAIDSCEGCYFLNNDCGYSFSNKLRPSCIDYYREDKKDVIFVEVEDESME